MAIGLPSNYSETRPVSMTAPGQVVFVRVGLRQLRPVVRCSSEDTTKTLVQAFIASRLDYCNVLYYGIYDELIRRLQSVQYAAASLVVKVLDAHQYFRCLI